MGSLQFQSLKRRALLALLVGMLNLFVTGIGSEQTSALQANDPSSQLRVASIQHEIFVGDANKPVLIICEETHASLEVQRNCQLAIEELKMAGVQPVLLAEGTSPGQLEMSTIFNVGPRDLRSTVTQAWLELGWLSGIEMAALQDSSLPLFGVEDLSLKARHEEALNQESSARKALIDQVNSLLQEFQFSQANSAWERFRQAKDALDQSVGGALSLEEAARILEQQLNQGSSIRETLAELQQDFSGASATFSARYTEWEEARDELYNAIIESAREAELDVSHAEDLQKKYRRRQAEAEAAKNARHGPIVANAQQALASEGAEVGILAIGAGHTVQLKRLLRDQGISYLVMTPDPPGLRIFTTPRREEKWFQRNGGDQEPSTSLESWLGRGLKPELTLADPDKQKALSTDIALTKAIKRALRGENPGVPDRLLIDNFQARSTPDGVDITVEGQSGRQLRLQFPVEFQLTDTAAKELTRHLMEALQADTQLTQQEDGFFTPAAHLYLEPGGIRGGAFVSYKSDASTLVTRAASLELPSSSTEDLSRAQDLLQQHQDSVQNPSRDNLDDLLRPLQVLRPFVDAVNRSLDELGVPEDQVVPVVLRMARISDEAILREINFTLLAAIARQAGIDGFQRRLMFVKSGLERDSEHIEVGSPEQLLDSTLTNMHAWSSTDRHVAAFTIPTSEPEWDNNPFAQYLENRRGLDHEWYKEQVLPSVQDAIQATGPDNVLQPQDLDQFLGQLEGALSDADDATVTITFVGHRVENREGLWVHFKGSGSEVRLDTVVSRIRSLQEQGTIPASANLEFNVIVCSAEEGAAPQFIKQLDARLILASPHKVDVATNMRLLINQATWLGRGLPTYRAYLRAVEALVDDFFNDDLPSLELTEPFAMETNSDGSPTNV